jgi:Zn-dependent protease
MTFRLFGVPVEVELGFWLTAFFLTFGGDAGVADVALRMALVFVSILAHELGHVAAVRWHRIEPSVTLHWMGGSTHYQPVLPISRPGRVVISLAGPMAGLLFAAMLYAAGHLVDRAGVPLPAAVDGALAWGIGVNVFWSLFNLAPVLPLDGGHVLEAALGPKRERLTAGLSLGFAVVLALFLLKVGAIFGAMLIGLSALRSFERLRGAPATPVGPLRAVAPPHAPGLSGHLLAALRRARRALEDERFDDAITLAEEILAGRAAPAGELTPPAAAHGALEILAWALLLSGRAGDAARAYEAAERIERPDLALGGALALEQGDRARARRLLEAARRGGDDRKEVVGPLIQILLDQGEIARAAAIAFDIVESLSDDDLRKMAAIAFDGGAYDWSARLYEAAFGRDGRGEDAYHAARAHAKDGHRDRALALLRRAVDAGFSDRARALSDAALEALRGDPALDSVLPRS